MINFSRAKSPLVAISSTLVVALALVVGPALHVSARQAARPSTVIDSAQLLLDLKTLSADDMEGRLVGTPGGEKARAYVVERFKASGLQPVGGSFEHPFTFRAGRGGGGQDRQGVNVLGQIAGSSPGPYLVVSAHYDHVGTRGGQIYNGADDNASGTAALFALAKYFSTHTPAHPILFAAFDAEEAGLRGARAFVAAPPVPAASLALDVNMDMIGRDPDDKLFVVGTHTQPFLKPYIERIAAAAPVKLLMGHDDPARKDVEDWTSDSDHAAFCSANIPCLYFGVEDFPQHHKPTDDYETMTYDFYIRAVETLVAAVKEFDASLEAIAKMRGSAGGAR
ncbi:MAG: M28 family peptidase [Vicinamibacterales bacterium]